MTNSKQTILIICGPTASGKTSFALEVAKSVIAMSESGEAIYTDAIRVSSQLSLRGTPRRSSKIAPSVNILSVDSRQVYKDLEIITGKDIPENLPANIHFYGLNIFDIKDSSNLADFLKYSQKIIDDSIASNTPLIIVGGTGLYLKAITQNLSDITVPQDRALRKETETLSLKELQCRLQDINIDKYDSMNNSDVNNPRRLIRAIEISTYNHNNTICHSHQWESIQITPISHASFHWVGFMPEKDDISEAIKTRVIERLENGATNEVKKLLQKNPDTKLPVYTSLGVSQILSFLQSKISLEELKDIWARAEIDYARRQIVWFKKQVGIIWYDKGTNRKALAKELAKKLINKNDKEKTR